MGVASLIITPLHDLVITVGVPMGSMALLGICVGLARERAWGLLILGFLALAAAAGDYAVWEMAVLKYYQPMIQKSAFLLFFGWVMALSWRVLRQAPPARPIPAVIGA